MNKHIFRGALLLFFLLLPATVVRAESLDEEQARYAAAEFFSPSSQSTRLRAKGRQLVLRSNGHEKGYYIFDRPEGGVVFVADDDAIGRTVLGYTDGGSFDSENLSIGMQDWLDQVGVLMDAVHEGKINRTDVRRKAGDIVVPQLTSTYWNQRAPYNNLCPTKNGQRCLTGCVATAMAQVMRYWSWPKYGSGSVSYYDEGCGQMLSTDLSSHEYDWGNMLADYSTGNYTAEQATAVATLMRDCGYAVQMHYTPEASAAVISARTMQTYFNYSAVAKDRYVGQYPEDMWHDYIRQDLQAGRPVLYNGQGADGHEFILDGYDSGGYYHVNWGWGGWEDGWFMLTNLHGYNNDQWMINNLVPDYVIPDGETPSPSGNDFSYSISTSGVLTIRGTGSMPEIYQLLKAPWRDKCEQIRKIVISEGITSIVEDFGFGAEEGDVKLYMFSNLQEIVLPEGLLYIGENAFRHANKLTSVQLPSTLISSSYAFFYCENIKSLHLPKDINEFYDYLPNLSELTVDEQNPSLCAKDNVLYSKNGKHLLFIPQGLERITIAETTEDIYDSFLFQSSIPILSKCTTAPGFPQYITEDLSYARSRGCIFVPYGSSGYDRWKSLLPSEWRIITYTDIVNLPDMKTTWTLDNGTLTISGWREQRYETFGGENAPYFPNRSQIRKLVVSEGTLSLCWNGFWGYANMTEAELPSTLSYIDGYCFSYSGLKTITCYARQAPTLYNEVFNGMPGNGTLRVPEGADYSSWLTKLPNGWRVEYFTPEPLAVCHLYTGETSTIDDLTGWETLRKQYPNVVGIVNPRYKDWAYMSYNMLKEDATAEGGYRCPYFCLTDLSYNYATTNLAPATGFCSPVPFSITKGEYKRKLVAGYNTVCLPFAISEDGLPANCSMYAYSYFDYEKEDAVFSPQSTTKAGHPCFITSKKSAEWQTDLSGMTITALQPSAEDAGMRGTFVSTEEYQGIGYNPRSKDNIFAPLAWNLHPFRACFIIDIPSAPEEVNIRLSDEADRIVSPPGETEKGAVIYNLAGQRIGKMKRGVNIIDGKIVIR